MKKYVRRELGRALRDENRRRNAHRSQNIGLVADGACVTKKDTDIDVLAKHSTKQADEGPNHFHRLENKLNKQITSEVER